MLVFFVFSLLPPASEDPARALLVAALVAAGAVGCDCAEATAAVGCGEVTELASLLCLAPKPGCQLDVLVVGALVLCICHAI